MKKFYAFAIAAVAALSMNAQNLYVCGAGEGLAWEPENPMVVAAANGAWTFNVKGMTQMKVSTAYGDWNAFNAAAYCAEISADLVGVAVEMAPADGNLNAPWEGDWHIVITVVDGHPGTITMTTDTPQPVGGPKIYVRGDMNGWLNDASEEVMAQWQFTQSASNEKVFTIDCAIEADLTFKIADSKWFEYNYSLGDFVFAGSEDYWNYNDSNNTTMGEDWEGTITLTIGEKNTDPAFVQFSDPAGVANVKVDANAPAEYFNLQGVRVANPENGLFIVRQGNKVTKVIK